MLMDLQKQDGIVTILFQQENRIGMVWGTNPWLDPDVLPDLAKTSRMGC